MVFGLGSHDSKDREELDQNYYKRRKIYLEAKEKERENMARQRGIQDARAIANKKPFYQKVIGLGMAIGKDLTSGAAKTDPSKLFNWGEPKQQRRRRSGSKKRRQRRQPRKNPYSLL